LRDGAVGAVLPAGNSADGAPAESVRPAAAADWRVTNSTGTGLTTSQVYQEYLQIDVKLGQLGDQIRTI
jgi:hypothetical protein